MGEGIKLLCIKNHVRSSINDFRERNRAIITKPSFAVGRLNRRRKKMNNRRFYNFPRITVDVYFTEFESIIVYRSTHGACCLSEKAYNIRVREFSAVTFCIGLIL